MKKSVLLFFFFISIAQIAFSQTFDKQKLDTYFSVLEEKNKFMGNVAISQNGKLVYSRAVGFSDIENKIKADESSLYRVGSISKTFTAVLILKAIEQNLVSLDNTIEDYFPSLKNIENITVEHLLNHRSGIHSYTAAKNYLDWNTKEQTAAQLIKIIKKGGIDFKPNEKFEYSNSNYALLTFILEKIFKKPYKELLEEHITKPLGLTNTYFGKKAEKKECKSYMFTTDWIYQNETDPSNSLGAGGVVSTPIDLLKFNQALFSGKLLKEETLQKMLPKEEKYGLGIFKIPFYETISYGHTGGIDGFSSVFSYFKEENVSFAITSNAAVINTNDISIAVLSAIFGKDYMIPDFKVFEVTAEQLDTYLGLYASEQMPLKIEITKDGKNLMAQATGQSPFPLTCVDLHKFKFEPATIEMLFEPSKNIMHFKQGNAEFLFTRE